MKGGSGVMKLFRVLILTEVVFHREEFAVLSIKVMTVHSDGWPGGVCV